MRRAATGMILGKFLPPHAGHLHLARSARGQVERLFVIVERIEDEMIPSELRARWMQELLPDCEILHLDRCMPQTPEAHPEFWALWRSALQAVLPVRPERVFASESYGARLAAELGARFVPCDPGRLGLPISATRVRANPAACWPYLPPPVRAYFTQRVVLFGPESTGKSTAAARLAAHFDTVWVPEHGATVMQQGATVSGGTDLVPEDLEDFALGQIAAEDSLARAAGPRLFCDSDPLTACVWSQHLFGAVSPSLRAAAERPYALTLLFDVDLPWVDDAHRLAPEGRGRFFEACRSALEAAGRPYRVIRGAGEARFEACVKALEALSP